MNVAEIMQRNVMTVEETDRAENVLRLMLAHGVRHAPVVRKGEVVGVVSERNLLGHRARYQRDGDVAEVMTAPAYVAAPAMSVAAASALMATRKIGCLPVVHHGDLVGIVTTTDMLSVLAQEPVQRPPWRVLCAGDVMQRALETVHAHDSLAWAALKMLRRGVRHLPVVDHRTHLIGMLSDRDLRSAVGDPELLVDAHQLALRLDQRCVADVMTRTPAIAALDTPVTHLARRLSEERLGALAIVDQELRLHGIVSYVDVLQAVLAAA
jgi:CBS domain-containing protein